MALARVLLVEDDSFSRTLLSNLLSSEQLAATSVSSAKAALELLATESFQVALLDIDLGPGPTGIDLAHAMRERQPSLGIVFLTSFIDHRLSKAGDLRLPQGARYLTKGELEDGGRLIAAVLSAALEPLSQPSPTKAKVPLSSHQLAVLRLVAAGLTNAEIARQLGVSQKGVEHVISRMLIKLQVPKDEKLNPRVLLTQAYADLSGKPAPR